MHIRPVVIDTNCLVQIISKHSPYRKIWDAFLGKQFVLCVSNEILEEYQEILEHQTTPEIAENILLLLINQRNVRYVDPHFRLKIIIADPDDDKFVDCAFAAGADIIVSEDSHFDVLKSTPFPYINVMTMEDFVQKQNLVATK
jgi:putative PIN family toxin of toxin-antitoxin system